MIERCPRGLQNLADVPEDLMRLLDDPARDDVAGFRIGWNLSGEKQQASREDRLRVRPIAAGAAGVETA